MTAHFAATYERIDSVLENQPYLHGISPGMSDALLFEHMCGAMSNAGLRVLLEARPLLLAHFKAICNDYFTEFDWEVGIYLLRSELLDAELWL